jgi:hypothetical protein
MTPDFRVYSGQRQSQVLEGEPAGKQNDILGTGLWWCGLAITDKGNIPGKCKQGQIQFIEDGRARKSNKFTVICD